MTTRADWRYDGKWFRETYDINCRRICFIDGVPMARQKWLAALVAAKKADEAKGKA